MKKFVALVLAAVLTATFLQAATEPITMTATKRMTLAAALNSPFGC